MVINSSFILFQKVLLKAPPFQWPRDYKVKVVNQWNNYKPLQIPYDAYTKLLSHTSVICYFVL